jgi:hypothetical protein
MTRARLVTIVGVPLFIVGATAGSWWFRRPPEAPAPSEAAAAVIADLRDEVARLRGELTRTKARAAVSVVVAAATRASVNERHEPPSAPVISQTPAAETPAISEKELLQRTEELFRSEGQDPVWSAQALIMARQQLSPAIGDRGRMQVECRSSICRAEIVYPDHATYDLVTDQTSAPLYYWRGGRTSLLPSSTPDGKIVVVHYLFREGEDPQRDIYAEEEAKVAASRRP